jgi:threonine dehydrogenase-like Zn-dependent dehydrogenase
MHEAWRGRRARTFDACLELLTTTSLPVDSLVTHSFALQDYPRAIDSNLDRREHRSIKAVFDLRAHA